MSVKKAIEIMDVEDGFVSTLRLCGLKLLIVFDNEMLLLWLTRRIFFSGEAN